MIKFSYFLKNPEGCQKKSKNRFKLKKSLYIIILNQLIRLNNQNYLILAKFLNKRQSLREVFQSSNLKMKKKYKKKYKILKFKKKLNQIIALYMLNTSDFLEFSISASIKKFLFYKFIKKYGKKISFLLFSLIISSFSSLIQPNFSMRLMILYSSH